MSEVVKFPLERVSHRTPGTRQASDSAEILFFSGVRYSRLGDDCKISNKGKTDRSLGLKKTK